MTTDGSLAGRDPAPRASRRRSEARAAAPSDWLRVSWLIETSRRVFTHWGGESLRDLLAAPGAVVWQQGRALRGALVVDARRGEAAEARLLAIHDDADAAQFGDEVLPLAEGRLARRGVRWLSFSSPDDWLLELLARRGYTLKDRVITYVRQGLNLDVGGNAEVAVRRALPEDLPGMLAVDVAAFEPFWRMGGEALGRALVEEAYVLVALEESPLPDPLPELGEREQEAGAEPSAEGGRGGWRRSEGKGSGVVSTAGRASCGGGRRGWRCSEGRGGVVGYVVADVWEARAHIVRLGVAPAYQGRGVATRLIAELFRLLAPTPSASRSRRNDDTHFVSPHSADLGVNEVTLNTQETNARSRSLYEGLGFRLTGSVEEVWARELEAGRLRRSRPAVDVAYT